MWPYGSSINDVTKIWIIFDPPSPPIVTQFFTKTLVLLSQNPWHPLPLNAVTSFMDDPLPFIDKVLVLIFLSRESWKINHETYHWVVEVLTVAVELWRHRNRKSFFEVLERNSERLPSTERRCPIVRRSCPWSSGRYLLLLSTEKQKSPAKKIKQYVVEVLKVINFTQFYWFKSGVSNSNFLETSFCGPQFTRKSFKISLFDQKF